LRPPSPQIAAVILTLGAPFVVGLFILRSTHSKRANVRFSFGLLVPIVIATSIYLPIHRRATDRATCIGMLYMIDSAKQDWAHEGHHGSNEIPAWLDLYHYGVGEWKNGGLTYPPQCPAGGTYTVGRVGVLPTCSIPGHVLPFAITNH
jgi:hypothetical protein